MQLKRIIQASVISVGLTLAAATGAHAQATATSASPNPGITSDSITVTPGTQCPGTTPTGAVLQWVITGNSTSTSYPYTGGPLVLPPPLQVGSYTVTMMMSQPGVAGQTPIAACETVFTVTTDGGLPMANPTIAASAFALAGAGVLIVRQRRRRAALSGSI
jgi:hypothetical protein